MGPQTHLDIPEQSYHDDETAASDDTLAVDNAYTDESGDEFQLENQAPPRTRYVPEYMQKAWKSVVIWVKGPQPPRIWRIRPFFPEIQEAPIRLLETYFPKRKQKIGLLIGFYFVWALSFVLVMRKSAFASDIPGYGAPVRLSCTARFWGNGNECGLDGDRCRPFNNVTFPFRCPANCKRIQVVNPHAVGDQEINYRPLVIGGPHSQAVSTFEEEADVWGEDQDETVYRGDSFICSSAIHSGFVSNGKGGCGVLQLVGTQSNFTTSIRHGISSIGFDSYFPLSFSFVSGTATQCQDLRWSLLGVSLTFTILLSLFTTSPPVFFASLFVGMFMHVGLVSDPPTDTDYYALVSITFGRFLPAAFCMAVMYYVAVRRTLTNLTAQFEKTILWLGAAWVGALNNYTFDKIPIERLTPHDIKQQPGAVPALIIIVLSIFAIALGQAWGLRVEGRMPKYLAIYGTFVGGLLILVAVPKMNVRIHHYILGLLLMPGTAMQNRPSLVYQGLLFGLFINGIARWGFDSLLQTPDELRGDGQFGSLLPIIMPPVIHLNNLTNPLTALAPNITFTWKRPLPKDYDGISILVNDVERFHSFDDGHKHSFTWVREPENNYMPEYFRFGYLTGRSTADYSKAGTWEANGGWKSMESGPSLAQMD